jgi:hypothetical protein
MQLSRFEFVGARAGFILSIALGAPPTLRRCCRNQNPCPVSQWPSVWWFLPPNTASVAGVAPGPESGRSIGPVQPEHDTFATRRSPMKVIRLLLSTGRGRNTRGLPRLGVCRSTNAIVLALRSLAQRLAEPEAQPFGPDLRARPMDMSVTPLWSGFGKSRSEVS